MALLDDIIPSNENEQIISTEVDENAETIALEAEFNNLMAETENYALSHDKLEVTASVIDKALEAELGDTEMDLLAEAISMGLGVTLEKENAPKTSENIKASFKKFIAQFVTFVRKVWTKFMNAFAASADKITALKTEVKGVKGEVTLDKLPFIAALEIAGGGLGTAVKNMKVTDSKLTKVYATKDIAAGTGFWNTLTGLTEGKSGVPAGKYIKGKVADGQKGTLYTLPKSSSSFATFAVIKDSENGKGIGRGSISLNTETIMKEAEGKKVKANLITKYLDKLSSKEDINTKIDAYYGYTKSVTDGDLDNKTKTFYANAVKYAFTVVNAEMAFNKGVYSDAKKFVKASGSNK